MFEIPKRNGAYVYVKARYAAHEDDGPERVVELYARFVTVSPRILEEGNSVIPLSRWNYEVHLKDTVVVSNPTGAFVVESNRRTVMRLSDEDDEMRLVSKKEYERVKLSEAI